MEPVKPGATLPPETTEEENTVTAGQRKVNIMWETTQARIALFTVITNLGLNAILCVVVVMFGIEVSVTQMALVTLCLQPVSLTTGIVIGFYFSRTNHVNIGGTGKKEQGQTR